MSLPDALFVIDVGHEKIAIHEAKKLGIPVVAVVDTNCSPDDVDYVVPGNDDAMRAIQLYAEGIADAVLDGKSAMPEVPTGEDEFVELDEEGQPKPKSGAPAPRRGRPAAVARSRPPRRRAAGEDAGGRAGRGSRRRRSRRRRGATCRRKSSWRAVRPRWPSASQAAAGATPAAAAPAAADSCRCCRARLPPLHRRAPADGVIHGRYS